MGDLNQENYFLTNESVTLDIGILMELKNIFELF